MLTYCCSLWDYASKVQFSALQHNSWSVSASCCCQSMSCGESSCDTTEYHDIVGILHNAQYKSRILSGDLLSKCNDKN